MLEYNQDVIRFTEDNFPLIEHTSRWYGHEEPLTDKRLHTILSQYKQDNPDHPDPYLCFAKEFPENSSWEWALVPAKYFDENYEIHPDWDDVHGMLEDELVPVKENK